MGRRGYLPAIVLVDAVAAVQLLRGGANRGQRRGVLVALAILTLTVAAAGEVSPELATGFAALLAVAVLLGGTNAVHYLFVTLPNTAAGKEIVR